MWKNKVGQTVMEIKGRFVSLRLITTDDAAFVHELRTDTVLNKHLSAVTGDVSDQEAWLHRYKRREANGEEFYLVVERQDDGTPCGLVRLYDIKAQTCTWGSFILGPNKPKGGALEAAFLSFSLTFDRLGLHRANIDVRNENTTALRFYERFGMRYLRKDAQDTFLEYTRDMFETDRIGFAAAIGDLSKR